jgi:hypothetical protein
MPVVSSLRNGGLRRDGHPTVTMTTRAIVFPRYDGRREAAL